MTQRPIRLELESTGQAGPAPAVALLPPGESREGVLAATLDREGWSLAEHGQEARQAALGEWLDAAPGWRVRVVECDAPGVSASVSWTSPELEFAVQASGKEHIFVCPAPVEEGAELIVGRGEECGVCLEDGHVSRRHLRLFVRKGRLLAEDLRSKWGTTLNGRALAAPSELAHSDRLVLGTTTIRYICYWDVLTRPTRPAPEARASDSPTATAIAPPGMTHNRPPRPVLEPPPPPSALEQNAKLIALGIFALCCLLLIVMLMRV
ncbi:MAG: FHA domain-containing protein [Planctomycetes bacterium]|nr:FHA domain-containing protein [Planctomycetota bacterium]